VHEYTLITRIPAASSHWNGGRSADTISQKNSGISAMPWSDQGVKHGQCHRALRPPGSARVISAYSPTGVSLVSIVHFAGAGR